MKKTLFWAYLALLFVYLLPVLSLRAPAEPAAPRATESAAETALLALRSRAERPPEAPAPQTLRVLRDGEVTEMELQGYLVGVVAAEMPAAFPEEALKAQAVAARSYALYCATTHKHAEADVCTDPGCCQAWLSEAQLRENWGGAYAEYLERIRSAVGDTAGEYLSYGGAPVFAAFHSSSAGATEDCGAVWRPQPYLVSVSSPETASDVPGYVSTLRCAPLDFRDTLLSIHPEADFSGEPSSWLGSVERDASGRVERLSLGGVSLPGTEIRRLFSLRSTAFTLEYTEGVFLFTVTGYGHGVGMSQYGAKVLAQQGADYAEILAHYYPGTVLTQ